MFSRHMKLATSLAAMAALAACTSEAPDPVGVQQVQLAVIGGSAHGGKPMATHMTQEVTHTPAFSGDPDGYGTAKLTVNHGQGEVCWDVSVSNVTLPATASHIHKEVVGVRGPVVVGLTAPDASGHSSGCATGVDRDLLRDILTNPTNYYVNVHTTDFPPGAVRGQLGR